MGTVFPVVCRERCRDVLFLASKNHGAHVREFLFPEKHMLCTAESDALGSKGPRLNGIAWNVRVGTDLHRPVRLRPCHELK